MGCGVENTDTVITGALIVLYTMISTSTANVAVITLPYLKSEFYDFPNLSLISGLMSAAKITSSFLIFIFPSSNYEIMIVLGVKAVIMTALSEANTFLPLSAQGTWVGVCIVLLTFSCGSTVARALTITKNEDDTKFLSNCFTVGKSAVHAVELLATTVFYSRYQWDGLVVWICSAYSFVTVTTIAMFVYSRVKEKRARAAKREQQHQVEHQERPSQDLGSETDLLMYPEAPRSPRSSRAYSVEEELFVQQEEEFEWPPEEIRRSKRARGLSVNSIGSILTSISQTRQMKQPSYMSLLWKDVSKASLAAWLYLFFSESAGMSLAVIILCGTKYVKDTWNFSPDKAALTIVLPQLLVIPVFCLVSLLRIDNFTCVIFGNAMIAIIALLPFINQPIGWSCVIFVCELFNAMRTSSQMPGFNLLVPSPRIARRFISISTLFIFTLRTIGYSGGTALYEFSPSLPFIVCGACQIFSSLVLCFLLWWQIPKIAETRRQRNAEQEEKASSAGVSSIFTTGSPISDASRANEHVEP